MPALQVREFPEELYEQLRAYAAAQHRSMAQQTIAAVDQMINGRPSDRALQNSAHALPFESEEEKQRLRDKRSALWESIQHLNERYEHARMPIDEIVAAVYESREERSALLEDVFRETQRD